MFFRQARVSAHVASRAYTSKAAVALGTSGALVYCTSPYAGNPRCDTDPALIAGTALASATVGALGGWFLAKRSAKAPMPAWADKYRDRVLYTPEQIQDGVRDLAAQLNRDYADKPTPLLVGVLSGVYMTMADLTRLLEFEHDVDFIKASSYGTEINASAVKIETAMKHDVTGRDVILIDELVDTGKTFASTAAKLKSMGAKSVKLLCVLDKPDAHKVDLKLDYCALICPNEWVFGYGLDCKERLRSLPYVGIVTEEFKKS